MNLKKFIFISVFCIFAVCLGALFFANPFNNTVTNEKTTEKPATETFVREAPKSSESIEIAAEETTRVTDDSDHKPFVVSNVATVSLDQISNASGESNHFYQNLSLELINEIAVLETVTDVDVIKSRLTPVVQKFYYLKKTTQASADKSVKRLPSSFQQDIDRLEILWNKNPELAYAVDDIFASFNLLDCEHVPYQLREELALSN